MWPQCFDERLLEWNKIREDCKNLSLDECLSTVNRWWQYAPIDNHYLHWTDIEDWPLPWDILADNIYCDIAKALGIVYTLILIEHPEVDTIEMCQTQDYNLVYVNGKQYILNYLPESIYADKFLEDQNIKRSIGSKTLEQRLI